MHDNDLFIVFMALGFLPSVSMCTCYYPSVWRAEPVNEPALIYFRLLKFQVVLTSSSEAINVIFHRNYALAAKS